MTMLSLSLSRAASQGCLARNVPPSRAALLAGLLRKRAAAQVAGAEDLEALLRDQILRSLPIEKGAAGD